MVYRFNPTDETSGQRIDQFISSQHNEFSRGFIRKIIDLGGVHCGGRRIRKCSYNVKSGEPVEVYIDDQPLDIFTVKDSDIIYRDQYLIAFNKLPGVETQPTPARYKGTLYEAFCRYLTNPGRPSVTPSLGMVQRLDRDTSGVMIFSIHPKAHKNLTQAFSGHEIKKTYLAIVQGRPAEQGGEIRSLLARSRANNLMKSVDRGGKEAITRYRVLVDLKGASLVKVEILTGRSHQIRIHMKEMGHPLLGDDRYGGPTTLQGMTIQRQMLHAKSLLLNHPVSGKPLVLEAPVPEDMKYVIDGLADPEKPLSAELL